MVLHTQDELKKTAPKGEMNSSEDGQEKMQMGSHSSQTEELYEMFGLPDGRSRMSPSLGIQTRSMKRRIEEQISQSNQHPKYQQVVSRGSGRPAKQNTTVFPPLLLAVGEERFEEIQRNSEKAQRTASQSKRSSTTSADTALPQQNKSSNSNPHPVNRNTSGEANTNGIAQMLKGTQAQILKISDQSSFVDFLVGNIEDSNRKTMRVHTELVFKASPVLKVQLEPSFVKGKTQKYERADFDPAAFRLWMKWVYREKIIVAQLTEPDQFKAPWSDSLHTLHLRKDAEDRTLMNLCNIAIALEMPVLESCVLVVLDNIVFNVGFFNFDTFDWLYNNTDSSSPLRRYIVRLCVYSLGFEAFSKCKNIFPADLILEIENFRVSRIEEVTGIELFLPIHKTQAKRS
ncbi:hypothetical protein BJ875DRAFT_480255 [Amylocarpus encephaloides]|uniref:BTB domain-containing protein n=1 Tax=Amylocarpus encephaloides TaxID=45428 RepID=A0A9P8C997_9HELO|nr:hypothetical protein BJ875DRAFT_480255 [Amylocarpus encephaloides]